MKHVLILISMFLFQISFSQSLTRTFDALHRLKEEQYPAYKVIYDYDNHNNLISKNIIWLGSPDLIVQGANLSSSQALPNDTLPLQIVAKNVGSGPASSSNIQVLLSADTLIDANDIPLQTISMASLLAQAQATYNSWIAIPSTTLGANYFVLVMVDASNLISESNENNNKFILPISICDVPVTTITSSSTNYCVFDLVSATATSNDPNATYQWLVDGQYFPGASGNVFSENLVGGTHDLRCIATYQASNFCYSNLQDTSNTIQVTISTFPTANFLSFPYGQTYSFYAMDYGMDMNTAFAWDFGDGQTDVGFFPIHVFSNDGTYNVCCTATNSCGSMQTCQTITIFNPCNPVLTLNGSSTCAGTRIFHLTGFPENSDIKWYRDNIMLSTTNTGPTATSIDFSETAAGIYYAEVLAPICGTIPSNSITITSDPPPTASFSFLSNTNTINFTNTSANSNGLVWNFGDGQSSTALNPMHTFSVPGTYTVCLVATNNCSSNTFCQNITISACNNLDSINLYTGLNTNPQIDKGGYAYKNGTHYLVWSNGTYYPYSSTYGSYDAKIKLSTSTDGITWQTTDILTTTIGSIHHVIAIDDNGKIHIAYVEGTSGGTYGLQAGKLVYAHNVNGTWIKQNTNLGTGNGYPYNWSTPYQLIFGYDNKLRMYYTTTGWYAFGGPLYMRILNNGTWSSPIAISTASDGGADSQNNIWSFTKKENGQMKVYVSGGWSCNGNGCTPVFQNAIREYTEGATNAYAVTNTFPNTRWYYENGIGNSLKVASDGQTVFLNGSTTSFTVLPTTEKIFNNAWISDVGTRVVLNTNLKSNLFKTGNAQNILSSSSKQIIPGYGLSIIVNNSTNPHQVYVYHDSSINTCFVNLNTKLFIQGFYIGNGNLNTSLFNQGVSTSTTICDSITVELHQPVFPFNLLFSTKVLLNTNGTALCSIPNSELNHSYYIVIKHRNSIETWSANPILLTHNTTYDFTSSLAKAYGSNMTPVGTNSYALFSGDINQDGSIDAFDYILMDPDIILGNSGYLATDLNGDGSADAFDFLILEGNIQNGINLSTP